MADKWAVDIVEALGKKSNPKYNDSGKNCELMIGKVVSANPFSLEINGQIIKKYLYINPAFTLLASNDDDKISEAFSDSLKLNGGMDGIIREPKGSSNTSTVDRYINVSYVENPIKNVGWFDFLREFHQKFVIKKGDTVIVIQVGVSFYILSKAVEL